MYVRRGSCSPSVQWRRQLISRRELRRRYTAHRNDQRAPKLKNRSFPEIICLHQLRNCSPIFLSNAAKSIAFPNDVLAEENPLAVGQRSNLLVEFVGVAFGKNQAEVETVRRRRPAED